MLLDRGADYHIKTSVRAYLLAIIAKAHTVTGPGDGDRRATTYCCRQARVDTSNSSSSSWTLEWT